MSDTLSNSSNYDIVIQGAGMVGASLAAALNSTHYRVLVLDKSLPTQNINDSATPYLRVSSINLGAIRWLKTQGIWQHINPARIREYNQLSAYEQGGTAINFSADERNEHKLGCFIENEHLRQAALACYRGDVKEAIIEQLNTTDDGSQLTLSSGERITTKLLVGADGGQSWLAQHLQFAEQGWQYRQHCLSINIQLVGEVPVSLQQETWQVFRPQGPIAFLPLFDNYASLIVYDSPEQINTYKQMNNQQLQQAMEKLFKLHHTGQALPEFNILEFASFPLARRTINRPFKQNCLLVGDAAHNIHPLAGQGVNLGLRDIAAASHNLLTLAEQKRPLNNINNWQHYLTARQRDVTLTSGMMDSTYKLFSNNQPILKSLRKVTLNTLNKLAPIKKTALHLALGLNDPHV